MKKRLIALVLALSMVMCLLAACGQSQGKESSSASESKKETAAESTAEPTEATTEEPTTAEPTTEAVAMETVTVTIEAESYESADGIEAYERETGVAVKYKGMKTTHTIWKVTVLNSGTYTFTAIGTGMVATVSGYRAIEGRFYINDELIKTAEMTTNEKYNPWDNPLESNLGTYQLEAGKTYTFKFEQEGGDYIMDKILAVTEVPADQVVTPSVEDIIIEAESHTGSNDTEAYEKEVGLGVKYNGGKNCHSTWTFTVENSGSYTFTAIGTGMVATTAGYRAIEGRFYVNDELVKTAEMTTNEKYNCFDNPLESNLGTVELEAGKTYTLKFEEEGGSYIMDKIVVSPAK